MPRYFFALLFLIAYTALAEAAGPVEPDAAKQVEGMFPGGVSGYLSKFGEPPLGEWGDPPHARFSQKGARFRITRLRPGALMCVRITRALGQIGANPDSFPVVVLKEGGFSEAKREGVALVAKPADVDALLKIFGDQELFSLPERKRYGPQGLDGVTWIFESWDGGGGYKIVGRWAPTGPAKVCADAVEKFLEPWKPVK
jgi:hypothetical protein